MKIVGTQHTRMGSLEGLVMCSFICVVLSYNATSQTHCLLLDYICRG